MEEDLCGDAGDDGDKSLSNLIPSYGGKELKTLQLTSAKYLFSISSLFTLIFVMDG